jgi:hypothetical protein
MNFIQKLIDGNLEEFKNNIEANLYSKLSSKLDEIRVEVASEIYNEEKCVPCDKKINEAKHDSYEDCVEFYMNAKDYSREDARRECGHQKTAGNIKEEE